MRHAGFWCLLSHQAAYASDSNSRGSINVWLPWCTNRHMMASDEVRLLSHNATYACDSDSDSAQSQLYIAHGDNFLHSFISVHITGWYGNIWVSIGEHDCRLSFVKKFDEHLFFVLTNGITQKNEDTWDLWSVNEYNGHSSSNFNKKIQLHTWKPVDNGEGVRFYEVADIARDEPYLW